MVWLDRAVYLALAAALVMIFAAVSRYDSETAYLYVYCAMVPLISYLFIRLLYKKGRFRR